ncbi:MAG: hypothetical protein KDA96_23145 [Planctomycetaceae bacterium]|nr:hypothetical protein [Planctomycetaceae bacterium]MCA9065992.1 hypothetical protein [Planctomycetaceae bacterium]
MNLATVVPGKALPHSEATESTGASGEAILPQFFRTRDIATMDDSQPRGGQIVWTGCNSATPEVWS